jgi:hypothetical protein
VGRAGGLAALFLIAGGAKLVLPLDALTKQMPLPGWFLRFVGTAEIMGAVSLILPGVLRIRSYLTTLAAAGLVIVMIGATAFTLSAVARPRSSPPPWGFSLPVSPMGAGTT